MAEDLKCKICGIELVYSGTGRKPAYCETHRPAKNIKTDKKPTSRKNASRLSDAALRGELLAMLQGLGAVVLTIDRFDGTIIISGAEGLVDAIMAVAEKNPAFRKWLETGSSSATWLQLAVAVGAIVLPIAAHHRMLPMDTDQMVQLFHPTLVTPPATIIVEPESVTDFKDS